MVIGSMGYFTYLYMGYSNHPFLGVNSLLVSGKSSLLKEKTSMLDFTSISTIYVTALAGAVGKPWLSLQVTECLKRGMMCFMLSRMEGHENMLIPSRV